MCRGGTARPRSSSPRSSPMSLTVPARYSAISGSAKSRRCALSRASVPSSSRSISRAKPTTSAARAAVSLAVRGRGKRPKSGPPDALTRLHDPRPRGNPDSRNETSPALSGAGLDRQGRAALGGWPTARYVGLPCWRTGCAREPSARRRACRRPARPHPGSGAGRCRRDPTARHRHGRCAGPARRPRRAGGRRARHRWRGCPRPRAPARAGGSGVSIARQLPRSDVSHNAIAKPSAPARAVRPMRWT